MSKKRFNTKQIISGESYPKNFETIEIPDEIVDGYEFDIEDLISLSERFLRHEIGENEFYFSLAILAKVISDKYFFEEINHDLYAVAEIVMDGILKISDGEKLDDEAVKEFLTRIENIKLPMKDRTMTLETVEHYLDENFSSYLEGEERDELFAVIEKGLELDSPLANLIHGALLIGFYPRLKFKKRDVTLAKLELSFAAQAGLVEANLKLGVAYYLNLFKDEKPDYHRAFEYFTKCVLFEPDIDDYSEAYYYLALMYLNGQYVKKDLHLAESMFLQMIDKTETYYSGFHKIPEDMLKCYMGVIETYKNSNPYLLQDYLRIVVGNSYLSVPLDNVKLSKEWQKLVKKAEKMLDFDLFVDLNSDLIDEPLNLKQGFYYRIGFDSYNYIIKVVEKMIPDNLNYEIIDKSIITKPIYKTLIVADSLDGELIGRTIEVPLLTLMNFEIEEIIVPDGKIDVSKLSKTPVEIPFNEFFNDTMTNENELGVLTSEGFKLKDFNIFIHKTININEVDSEGNPNGKFYIFKDCTEFFGNIDEESLDDIYLVRHIYLEDEETCCVSFISFNSSLVFGFKCHSISVGKL